MHRPRETGGEDGHGTESDDWLCGVGRDGGESVEVRLPRTEAVSNRGCTERGAGERDGDGRTGRVIATSSGQAQSKHIHGSVCLVHAELIQLIS